MISIGIRLDNKTDSVISRLHQVEHRSQHTSAIKFLSRDASGTYSIQISTGVEDPRPSAGRVSSIGMLYLCAIVHLVSDDRKLDYASYAVVLRPLYSFAIIGASRQKL